MRLPILLCSHVSASVGAFPLTGEGGTRSVTDEGEKKPKGRTPLRFLAVLRGRVRFRFIGKAHEVIHGDMEGLGDSH